MTTLSRTALCNNTPAGFHSRKRLKPDWDKTRNLLILKPGDKVYITRIEPKTESEDDLLKVAILSCDPLNVDDGASQKRYTATLSFKMPRHSLAESSPDQIEQMVETWLAPEVKQSKSSIRRVSSAPRAKPHPAAQPVATQNIALGQTIPEVVAIMGQPKQIVDLGAKKTYSYPNMKVLFVDGKVSDVQ